MIDGKGGGAVSGMAVWVLLRAGLRRHVAYRQATIAAVITNSFFGLLHCYVFLAVADGGTARGYTPQQLALYCWLAQGMIGVLALWGWNELGDRIRTGDVMVDLLRPVHPVVAYLATDLGRAAYAAMTRFVVPVAVGALLFDLYVPGRVSTYPLFVLSAVLAVVISFAGRYLVNATGFWLLDTRGPSLAWLFTTNILTGLTFPLAFLPTWASTVLWVATPFPWLLQAPLDIAVERGSALALVGGQVAWAAGLLTLCWWVQRRAEAKMVIQGG